MQPVKRIEIVVDSIELEKVIKILKDLEVSGYTIIKDVIGSGDRGLRAGNEVMTDVFKNSYVLTACPEDKLMKVVEAIRPVLKRFGGICLVSDAQWTIH
jgi:nitrogen regulatory protein PII